MTRGVVVAAALLVVALVGAPAAAAHSARIAADPPPSARLASGPSRVSATFNEPLQTAFAAMTVVGPDGNLWSSGDPQVAGAVVAVDVLPLGPAGRYTVNYRVTSADGHVVPGSWWFEVIATGTGTPGPPAAAAAPPGGVPGWPFLVGAGLVVGLAAVWVVRRRT